MLGVFGVVLPIRQIAYTNSAFLLGYRGGGGTHHGVWIHADRHGPLRRFQAPEIQNQFRTNAICRHFGHRARSYREVVLLLKNRVRVWRSSWLPLAKLLSLID
jgi:hypothetical protein